MIPASEQLRVIEEPSPRLAVMAGPGSGKTAVLIERITAAVRKGAIPDAIVAITFTNAAAREIEKRLREQFLGGLALAYCGTLHGFILRLLGEYGEEIGLSSDFVIIDNEQRDEIIKGILADLKIKLSLKDARGSLSGADGGSKIVAAEYYRRIARDGLMDCDSLLRFGIMLLHTGKVAPIDYLFWDEIQDSGRDDLEIMKALDVKNFFCVGDIDQSMYSFRDGFRGAMPGKVMELLIESGQWVIMALETNYRCASEICTVAETLISKNVNRFAKRVRPAPKALEGEVNHWSGFDDNGELGAIVQDLGKRDPSQCAILVRLNALVDRITFALANYGIPCRRKRSIQPNDWNRTREIIRLFCNPDNNFLMYRFIRESVGIKTADKLKLRAMKANAPINALLAGNGDILPAKMPASLKPRKVLEWLPRFHVSGESQALVEKIISELEEEASILELSYALNDEELLGSQESGEGVTVSTMHSAKGREWETVYLPAFEQGICPLLSKRADPEEERRIAFVAMTRAKSRLIISHAKSRVTLYGRPIREEARPSQFIAEAGL